MKNFLKLLLPISIFLLGSFSLLKGKSYEDVIGTQFSNDSSSEVATFNLNRGLEFQNLATGSLNNKSKEQSHRNWQAILELEIEDTSETSEDQSLENSSFVNYELFKIAFKNNQQTLRASNLASYLLPIRPLYISYNVFRI